MTAKFSPVKNDVRIRESNIDDMSVIREVHEAAFGEEEGPIVSNLVANLPKDKSAAPMLSLVTEEQGKVTGNVIFSSVKIDKYESVSAFLLAPLGIMPEYQSQGLGNKLVRKGVERLIEMKADLMLVYGDPMYYSRFGFVQNHKIQAPYKLQHPHGWQAMELKDGLLQKVEGVILCAESLKDSDLW